MSNAPAKPRAVYWGILAIGERAVIKVDAPVTAEQQPVLLTRMQGEALITATSVGSVEIEILNKSPGYAVAYALVIVPKTAIKAATLPWRDMIGQMVEAAGAFLTKLKS